MTRLDQRLVAEGLAPSRARARALIEAGVVTVDGRVATKPALATGGALALTQDPCPWVSRAGLKLDHALSVFGLTPSGTALDVGASTGGFTEVLLARGAAGVVAIDVGHGQLHPRLAEDPRVTMHEGVNAREIPQGLAPPVDWIVADVSFISLLKVLPSVLALARPAAHLVVLVKPQFEVGPGHVGKGGIVRDAAMREAVVDRIAEFLSHAGWAELGRTDSPIEGGDGNCEYLLAARREPVAHD